MRAGGVLLCVMLSGAVPLFAADTPRFEVVGAYAFLHDSDRSETFPAGWAFAATGNVNSWIGIVAEVGGDHSTCTNCQRGPFASQVLRGQDLHIRLLSYLGGPRIASHAASVVTPFAQVLLGGTHMSGGTEFDGALNTGFTYQPGVGIDVRVAPNVGVRLQGDYRIIRTTGHNNKQSRFLAGVVLSRGSF
jgi:hypothetical protein